MSNCTLFFLSVRTSPPSLKFLFKLLVQSARNLKTHFQVVSTKCGKPSSEPVQNLRISVTWNHVTFPHFVPGCCPGVGTKCGKVSQYIFCNVCFFYVWIGSTVGMCNSVPELPHHLLYEKSEIMYQELLYLCCSTVGFTLYWNCKNKIWKGKLYCKFSTSNIVHPQPQHTHWSLWCSWKYPSFPQRHCYFLVLFCMAQLCTA